MCLFLRAANLNAIAIHERHNQIKSAPVCNASELTGNRRNIGIKRSSKSSTSRAIRAGRLGIGRKLGTNVVPHAVHRDEEAQEQFAIPVSQSRTARALGTVLGKSRTRVPFMMRGHCEESERAIRESSSDVCNKRSPPEKSRSGDALRASILVGQQSAGGVMAQRLRHNSSQTDPQTARYPLLAMEAACNEVLSLAEGVGEITPDDNHATMQLQDASVLLSRAADLIREAISSEALSRSQDYVRPRSDQIAQVSAPKVTAGPRTVAKAGRATQKSPTPEELRRQPGFKLPIAGGKGQSRPEATAPAPEQIGRSRREA